MGIMRAGLSTATITVVAIIASVTLITMSGNEVPGIMETIVTLVLGAGAGAVGGYGVGKASNGSGTHG